jgi:hypothetical protein
MSCVEVWRYPAREKCQGQKPQIALERSEPDFAAGRGGASVPLDPFRDRQPFAILGRDRGGRPLPQVYRKLGVRSPTELARKLSAGG